MSECNHSFCKSGPYRARNGVLFGVCKGLANHFNFSVFWTRMIVVIGFIITGFWPVGVAYIVGAFLMKPAPVLAFESEDDAEFYGSYTASRSMALNRIKRTFDGLDRRIQRMESVVTDKQYDWDARLRDDPR